MIEHMFELVNLVAASPKYRDRDSLVDSLPLVQRSPGLRVELEPAALPRLVEFPADGLLSEVGIKKCADCAVSDNRCVPEWIGCQASHCTYDPLLRIYRRFPPPHTDVRVRKELVGYRLELL